MTPEFRDRTHNQEHRPLLDPGAISETLDNILDSAPFRTSKQCQELLRYVVEQSLGEDEESLKERVIGAEVFGRRPDYNTAEDPVVRIRAGEVRKRLALYYRTLPHNAKIEIDIPSGSYRAQFRSLEGSEPTLAEKAAGVEPPTLRRSAEGAQAELSLSPAPEPAADLRHGKPSAIPSQPHRGPLQKQILFLIVFVALAALLGGVLEYRHHASAPFESFWEPINANSKGPIIYVAGNQVYLLDARKITVPQSDGGEVVSNILPGVKIGAGDFHPDQTNYINKGDAAALSSIVWMLSSFKKPYDLRFSNDISISDIRQSPMILLGAFNNTWTLQLDDRLPLVFRSPWSIQEIASPHRSWKTIVDSHGNLSQDYSLVIRELHARSGGVAFTVAGLTMIGTRASAEFVTDPVRMNRALQQLPAGWQKKNIELLLHSNITGDLPTSTEVVTIRAW